MSEPAATRRDALRAGALGAAAIAANGLLRPSAARAQSPDDEDLRDFLFEAVGLEQLTVLAYSTAARAGDLDPRLKQDLTRFRDQEQAHATALRSATDSLGFDPPDAPDSTTDSEVFSEVDGLSDEAEDRLTKMLEELDGLSEGDELIEFASKLERAQLDLYLAQAPGLDSEDLSTTAAEIAGCQAQHLVVLRQELGDSLPDALVASTEAAAAASAEAEG